MITQSDMGTAECPPEYPAKVHEMGTGIEASDAVCDCQCSMPEGMTCSAPTLEEAFNSCVQFPYMPKKWQIPSGGCTNISTSSKGFSVYAGNLQLNGAKCDPVPTENVSPPAWQTSVFSCGSPGGDACGVGGQCVPEPETPLCVWVEGDTDCPAGPYEVQVVFHQSIADDRGCTQCTCGGATGKCGGEISLAYNNCQLGIDSIAVGGCKVLNQVPEQAGYIPKIEDAGCPPSGGAPTGSATADEPVTFCCTQ